MYDSGYPKVKQSLGQAALRDPYPAFLVDLRGVIYAANLMAFWLWDAIEYGKSIRTDPLLGTSIFTMLADNLERIPAEQNIEFYTKRSGVVKRMDARLELSSSLYAPFVAAMNAHPRLAQIYEHATLNPDREWEYLLRITPPGLKGTGQLLEFQVTNFRLEGDAGFLVIYSPAGTALPIVEEQYSLLTTIYSDKEYVLDNMQQDNAEGHQPVTDLSFSSRAYHPALIHDTLWYLISENKAHRLLVGTSVIGLHFFELFFAPQLREWLGPLQETSAPRAIRYFDTFTADFLREDHELHADYEQVMQRLLQVQGFRQVLEISRKLPIHINLPENTGTPFYTCRVLLPWPLSHEVTLQFRSMVRVIDNGLLAHSDRWLNEIILVPENSETEVALILLHIGSTIQAPDASGGTSLRQFLLGLAIMKTVKEGLKMKEGENTEWEPEAAFACIRNEVDAAFSKPTEDARDEVISELRVIIEALDRRGAVDKGTLLTMLTGFTMACSLDQLSKFFTRELEIHKKSRRDW